MQGELIHNLLKLISFCMAALLSVGLACFCCAKLCTKLDEGEKAMYMSMLTSVVSIWIPSPTSMLSIRQTVSDNEQLTGLRRRLNLRLTSNEKEEEEGCDERNGVEELSIVDVKKNVKRKAKKKKVKNMIAPENEKRKEEDDDGDDDAAVDDDGGGDEEREKVEDV